MRFCVGISPPTIALESCSNLQKIWQVLATAMKKNCFDFILSDVISGVVSGLFGPLHLALGSNC